MGAAASGDGAAAAGRGLQVGVDVESGRASVSRLSCAVCGCDSPPEALVAVRCGHRFCRKCGLRELLKTKACPACGKYMSVFSMAEVDSGRLIRTAEVTSPVGSVFIQFGKIGLASLHLGPQRFFMRFDPEAFEGSALALDDGSPFPREKELLDCSYDASLREFNAVVDWTPHQYLGGTKSHYKMVFDDGFEQIEGGAMSALREDGSVATTLQFGTDLLYRRVRSTIFPSAFVLDPTDTSEWPWVLRMLVNAYAWVVLKMYGLAPWMALEASVTRAPLTTLGQSSFHFFPQGSYVDYSRINSSMPTVPFVRQSFDPASRKFEGVMDFGNGVLGFSHLYFDEELEHIEGGVLKFYAHVRARGGGDVFSVKYENVLPEQLVFVKEEAFGSKHEGDGSPSTMRFRLVQPWQVNESSAP